MLFHRRTYYDDTLLDRAIYESNNGIITLILQIMVAFQNHPMHNHVVDRNICYLIKNRFDLKDYFESKLPWFQAKTMFKEISTDRSSLIAPSSSVSLIELRKSYKEFSKKKIIE